MEEDVMLIAQRSRPEAAPAGVLNWRHFLTTVAATLLLGVSTTFGQSPHLGTDSPLATDGKRLFAVAPDGATVLVRSVEPEAAPWEPIRIDAKIRRIGGLAARDDVLYVSDSEEATLYRIELARGHSEIVHKGVPLMRPIELAVGKMLFVADPEARKVFQVSLGSDTQKIEPVKALPDTITGEGSLAYSNGTLAYAEGENIWRVTQVEGSAGGTLETLQGEGDSDPRKAQAQTRSAYKKGRDSESYPTIEAPRSIAAFNGVAYAVSGQTGLVYVTPRLVRKAVNASFGLRPGERRTFRRIALTESWLFAIDAARGDVVRWRRPVPVEFTMDSPPRSECLSALYAYLRDNDALPSRAVPLRSSLERTLREEGALASPYVSALDDVVCSLNAELCVKGKPKKTLAAGTAVYIPDLFVEAILVFSRRKLDGKTPLGAIVDNVLRSEDFYYAREEAWLRRLNKIPDEYAQSLRETRVGEFILPNVLVRYVVAVPAAEVVRGALSARLDALRGSCPGLTINPLERREAVPSNSGACVVDQQTINDAHVQLVNAIHAVNLPSMQRANVAVVESEVDTGHPDFASDTGATPFTLETKVTDTPPTIRCFEPADHGTGVTAVIGAQRWLGKSGTGVVAGLAADSYIDILTADLASLPTAMMSSPLSSGLDVVNMSAKSESSDDGLLRALRDNQNTLFVVAAGNSKGIPPELCSNWETKVFPACYPETEVPNVLVVGATTLDGASWLHGDETTEGSNWSAKRVHIAAPGTGYWLPGKAGAYVPVSGTSFATPLVAATAARLAPNLRLPWQIKYRIIATADYVANLRFNVMGGLLNVERAVTSLDKTLIQKKGEEIRPWFLDPGQVVKIHMDGKERMIPAERILRLTRLSQALYRIVFVSDSDTLQVSDMAEMPVNTSIKVRNDERGKASISLSDVKDYIGAAPRWKK